MATWSAVRAEAGPFADRTKAVFDAHRNKILATLRRDGSPRVSGIEVSFRNGELYFGGMYRSLKCLDLLRDARFALHSASVTVPDDDPGGWPGDAKLAGRAIELTDPDELRAGLDGAEPPGPLHLFRADITELVLTRVGDPPDHLLVEAWHAGRGLSTIRRR